MNIKKDLVKSFKKKGLYKGAKTLIDDINEYDYTATDVKIMSAEGIAFRVKYTIGKTKFTYYQLMSEGEIMESSFKINNTIIFKIPIRGDIRFNLLALDKFIEKYEFATNGSAYWFLNSLNIFPLGSIYCIGTGNKYELSVCDFNEYWG